MLYASKCKCFVGIASNYREILVHNIFIIFSQKILQDFSQQLSWQIFTNSHLGPPLSHFFPYYYYSATSTGVKYFIKFFASTKILKKYILGSSY